MLKLLSCKCRKIVCVAKPRRRRRRRSSVDEGAQSTKEPRRLARGKNSFFAVNGGAKMIGQRRGWPHQLLAWPGPRRHNAGRKRHASELLPELEQQQLIKNTETRYLTNRMKFSHSCKRHIRKRYQTSWKVYISRNCFCWGVDIFRIFPYKLAPLHLVVTHLPFLSSICTSQNGSFSHLFHSFARELRF
jgi:hypothetical protein